MTTHEHDTGPEPRPEASEPTRTDAPNITRRAMLTLSTVLGLSGLHVLYSNLVNGLIESPELRQSSESSTIVPPPRNSVQMAERFLSAAPWAANAKYQMRTKEAFVYFEEWKRVNEHEAVRFWPFAIIWMQNEDALRKGPMTIIADSAFVKFENKFEITNDPGRVVAAALEGNAKIRASNGLAIDGRDFTYSESLARMWTDEHVTFAHGPNNGESDGLHVELLLDSDPAGKSFAAAGARTVRLKKNVRMNLVSEKGTASPLGGEPSTESTTATVTSDGPFEYDTETLVATYEQNVHVETPSKTGQLDTLSSDTLKITFAPNPDAPPEAVPAEPLPDGQSPTEGTGDFQSFETDLVFRHLLATGPVVRLHSEERDVTGLMKKLEYDGATRVVQMDDGEGVRLLNAGNELKSPHIRLVHAETGGQMESVLCRGAGRIQHTDPKTRKVDLDASWLKRMQIHPPNPEGVEMLDLEGDAVVRQTLEDSEMKAFFIRLWYQRVETPDDEAGAVAVAETPDSKPDDPGAGLVPRRLLALQDVELNSPKMGATTRRLEVWFEDANATKPETTPAAVSGIEPEVGLPIAAVPVRHVTRGQTFLSADDPTATAGGRSPIDSLLPGAGGGENGPMEIDADLIRVRATRPDPKRRGQPTAPPPAGRRSKPSELRELWTFGNVHVRQTHNDGKPPLDVRGEKLHIVNRGPNRELLHVHAIEPRENEARVPAVVRDRGMFIEGDRIHLDRESNRAWVEGPGALQLPVEKTPDGKTLPEPTTLDVVWAESMDFDGLLARFIGKVRTSIDANRVTCAEMHVTLNRRVSFTEDAGRRPPAPGGRGRKKGDKPEVATISCLDGVTFDGHVYEGSVLVAVRRAKFWQFDLDRATGDTVATGPGWVTNWQRGRSGGTGAAIVQANNTVGGSDDGWEYSRIDFEGNNLGNVNSRTSKFEGQVEIVHGPVERPLVVFDGDHLPEDGGWMRSDTLDLKQFEKTAKRPGYFTAFGNGNVYLRGREFYARADEIAFDQSKGRYVLRSKGDRSATIWRERPGGGFEPQNAKRMEFVPSRNVIKLDRTTGLDGSG